MFAGLVMLLAIFGSAKKPDSSPVPVETPIVIVILDPMLAPQTCSDWLKERETWGEKVHSDLQ